MKAQAAAMVEIEYLESTGTQYINLGVPFYSKNIYTFRVGHFANNSVGTRVFGTRAQNSQWPTSSYMTYRTGPGGNNYIMFYATNTMTSSGTFTNPPAMNINSMYTVEVGCYPTKVFKVNGTSYQNGGIENALFVSPYNITMFGDNTQGVPTARKARFEYIRAVDAATNVLELDLIPVRIGTVGYMYDRVSGQLFGNMGTGDFVLGPDVQ